MANLLEVLVVLNAALGAGGHQGASLDEIRQRHRLVSSAPPRLAAVQTDEAGVATLRTTPGVEAVLVDDLPEGVLGTLSPGERIFAQAWQMRRRTAKTARPGEGLSWDAPGFQAPDRPPGTPHRGER